MTTQTALAGVGVTSDEGAVIPARPNDPDADPQTDTSESITITVPTPTQNLLDYLQRTADHAWMTGLLEQIRAQLPKLVCPAALIVAGEHYQCDWPVDGNLRHDGWNHTNAHAEAIWRS